MSTLQTVRTWIRKWQTPQPLGRRGEKAAARFLKRRGYIIVGRSERDMLGEMDLIAVHQRTVVFVEVKTRKSHQAGHPAEAVGDAKQRRLTRLALGYLKRHDLLENRARFDVVAVTWPATAKKPHIEHFPNAFTPVGKHQMFG